MASSFTLSLSSSFLTSPLPELHKFRKHPFHVPNPPRLPFRFSVAAASSVAEPKKRHWKKGEYPGESVNTTASSRRRTPIKNIKKRMDHKLKAKAWVCTVTETLSDLIQKKNWLEALEVFPPNNNYLTLLFFFKRLLSIIQI